MKCAAFRRRWGALGACAVIAGGAASSASAQEVLLRNDDLPLDFSAAAISAGYGPGDIGATTFTLTAQQQADLLPMKIKRVQIAWMSYNNVFFQQPAAGYAMESINVYRGGYLPTPYTAPQLVYTSDPPLMQDSTFALNEFNLEGDNVILQAPLTKFTVGLQFAPADEPAYFALGILDKPSLVYDRSNNAVRNPVYDPGIARWKDYIEYGGTGDAVIRVVVERAVIPGCNLADITGVGGPPEPVDQQLTVDDLVAFVNYFSDQTGCPGTAPCNPADIVGVGGYPSPPDGELTVDDLVEFVNFFSTGC